MYHGSSMRFKPGLVLRPRPGGLCGSRRADADFVFAEAVLEAYRPPDGVPRDGAVYMVDDPQWIRSAGGCTDHVYEVEPIGVVGSHDLAWVSEIGHPEDNVLQTAADIPFSGQQRFAAEGYWSGLQHGRFRYFEYLATAAVIVRELPSV